MFLLFSFFFLFINPLHFLSFSLLLHILKPFELKGCFLLCHSDCKLFIDSLLSQHLLLIVIGFFICFLFFLLHLNFGFFFLLFNLRLFLYLFFLFLNFFNFFVFFFLGDLFLLFLLNFLCLFNFSLCFNFFLSFFGALDQALLLLY